MAHERHDKIEPRWETFRRTVETKQQRRLWARRARIRDVWFGLGMFGLVGWSVAVPAVAGVAIGIWIDATWPGRVSWTLTLLFVGVVLGCLNAWRWLNREGGA